MRVIQTTAIIKRVKELFTGENSKNHTFSERKVAMATAFPIIIPDKNPAIISFFQFFSLFNFYSSIYLYLQKT